MNARNRRGEGSLLLQQIKLFLIRFFLSKVDEERFYRILIVTSLVLSSIFVYSIRYKYNSIIQFLGAMSSITQLFMLIIWLKRDDIFLKENLEQIKDNLGTTKKDMSYIKEYLYDKEVENRRTIKIIKKLIDVGAVPEKEIYKLLDRRNDIFIVYTYGEGIPKRIKPLLNGKPPLIGLLQEMGFVRVALNQNLFVIFSKWLPRKLRNPYILRDFIRKELAWRWDVLSEKVIENFPKEKYKKFEKYRTKRGFKASFIIARCSGHDFIVDYMGKVSFNIQFQEKIIGNIDFRQLRKLIIKRKHEIRKILSKISMEILLDEIPRNHREIILQNEDYIKSSLKVKSFIDYRFYENDKDFALLLTKLIPSLDETTAQEYSRYIAREARKYYSVLEDLGIHFD